MDADVGQVQDDFQKELIELFGQEAQEWLVQIHQVLVDLERPHDADRHIQLIDTVVRAVTSLGGSAATVSLSDVEQATFALLPVIDLLKDRTTVTPHDHATVREQFRVVVTVVRAATGFALEIEPPAPAPVEPSLDVLTLLNALRTLQPDVAMGARSLVLPVMQRLELEARQGVGQMPAAQARQVLQEVHHADTQSLESLKQQLPGVAEQLSRYRLAGASAESASLLGACGPTIAQLQELAKQAQATLLVTFLGGLQSFVALVAQHRLCLAAPRVQAVESRIAAMLQTIDSWIVDGQQEHEAMGRLLSAA